MRVPLFTSKHDSSASLPQSSPLPLARAAFDVRCVIRLSLLLSLAMSAASSSVFAQNLVIANARILLGNGTVIEKGSLVVRDGRIASVSGNAAPSSAPGVRMDATGMTLFSGYIDGHRHLIPRGPNGQADVDKFFQTRAVDEMRELLEAGITTVQSGLDDPVGILKLRDMINRGEIKGPRIIASGVVPTYALKTEEEVRAAVDRAHAMGADSIAEVPYPFPANLMTCRGTCPGLPRPTEHETKMLIAGLDEARKLGMPFQVHATSPETVMDAVRIGVTRLVHTPHYDWVTDAQAREVAGLGVRMASCTAFATPVFDVFSHDNKPASRDGGAWPSQIQAGEGRGREAGQMPVNMRTYFDNGVDYGFATDTGYFAPTSVANELRTLNLVFSPLDLVKIMGQNSADFVDHGKDRGSLQAGKLADIVVLAGNPLDGYWNYVNPVMVIKGGVVMIDKRLQLHEKNVLPPLKNP